MSFAVRALKVGQTEIPGPELFWMSDWDRWHRLFFNVVLVQGKGITLLVNTGAPEDLAPINEVWTSILGERSRFERTETAPAGFSRGSPSHRTRSAVAAASAASAASSGLPRAPTPGVSRSRSPRHA